MSAGVPLVVDAAWAAHFGFHPALPGHALSLGADAMVTSVHKTLPAYNQAAILLVRSPRIAAARLARAFDATHTTSPSGAIMASIDASRALLEHHGERLIGEMLTAVAAARRRLAAIDGLRVLDGPGVDPAKLTVALAGTGAHGVQVESDLIAAGLPVEMADRDTIVAVVTVADDERRAAAADRRAGGLDRAPARRAADAGADRGLDRGAESGGGAAGGVLRTLGNGRDGGGGRSRQRRADRAVSAGGAGAGAGRARDRAGPGRAVGRTRRWRADRLRPQSRARDDRRPRRGTPERVLSRAERRSPARASGPWSRPWARG